MALRDMLQTLNALLSVGATESPGFPGTSEWMWGHHWPVEQAELEFPHAAKLVPTVFACLTQISNDVAQLPLRFYERRRSAGGEDVYEPLAEEHPLVALWTRGNPEMTGFENARDLQWSADQGGTGYLYLERFGLEAKPPQELWSMPSHLVRPIPGPRRSVRAYEWLWGGQRLLIDPRNVIAIRNPNPNASPLEPAPVGLSPLAAARLAYETRYDMADWQRRFYRKGGAVSNVYSLPAEAGHNEQALKAMKEAWEKNYAGKDNAFKAQFLTGGVKVERAGLTLEEMRFLEAARLTDADICMVFRVPPVVMGIKEGGGLSDAGATADLVLYWTQCIAPRVALRDAVLNARLCPLFGAGIVCETDLSGVPALQSLKLEQAKTLVSLAGRPILTANEARVSLGEAESDDETADELVVPFSVMRSADLAAPPPAPAAAAPPADPGAGPNGNGNGTAARARAARFAARTPGALAAARRRADRDLARYERRVAAAARALFSEQERRALARLEEQARADGMDVSAAFRPDELVPDDERDAEEFQRLYRALIAERGEAAAAEVGAEVALEVVSGRIGQMIHARAARLVTQIDDTTRRALADSLSDGTAGQETFSQLAARVREVFDGRRANALTIARTETAWAYNLAALEAWNTAGVDEKEWLTVGDEAVRESHSRCESEGAIPMSALFSNGCAFPGDPMGDAAETINCRCVLQPVVRLSDDETGAASRRGNGAITAHRLAHLFEGAHR